MVLFSGEDSLIKGDSMYPLIKWVFQWKMDYRNNSIKQIYTV